MILRLTHEVLLYLKSKGYTMLIGLDNAIKNEFVFTPIEWDVEKFTDSSTSSRSPQLDYTRHSIYLIDDLLGIELKHLFTHRVVIPEGKHSNIN